jgi:hypothetical protein
MDEKERDTCRVEISEALVKIAYERSGPAPLRLDAHAAFDHRSALQLNTQPGTTNIQEYGRKLYDLLILADPKQKVSSVFNRCFDDPPTYVQVRIEILDESLPKLLELSWEHLCDPDGRYLSLLGDRFRFVRRLAGLPPNNRLPLNEPPRVMVVLSNPSNLESFKVDVPGPEGLQEYRFAPIETPFDPQQTLGLVRLFDGLKAQRRITDYRILRGPLSPGQNAHPTYLSQWPTLDRINERLQAAEETNQPYHIVHFLAHGYLDENGEGHLLLTDENGEATPIHQDAFQSLFPPWHQVRLILFATCQSGAGEQKLSRPLAGLAPTLLRVGIPAVIAMQDEISVSGAAAFTDTFYQELGTHGYIDTAVAEARREVQRRDPQGGEWFIPVLYLQNENPRLFEPTINLSALNLTSGLFKVAPVNRFVNRDAELAYYADILFEAPNPAICWMWGPQMVGKRTMLEQLRYDAYQRGYGHLMMADRSRTAMVGTGSSMLYQLLRNLLEDDRLPQRLDQHPEAKQSFAEFWEDRTVNQTPHGIALRFLDGLERFAHKLERGIVCLFYFWDFEVHRNFLLGRAFEELVYAVADRYATKRLQRVRFMIATGISANKAQVQLFPAIPIDFFYEEELAGLQGIESVRKLCQCYGLSKDGQVPSRVLKSVQEQESWSIDQRYLPGPPVSLLAQLARRLDRGMPLDSLGVQWVSLNGTGGEQ